MTLSWIKRLSTKGKVDGSARRDWCHFALYPSTSTSMPQPAAGPHHWEGVSVIWLSSIAVLVAIADVDAAAVNADDQEFSIVR